MTTILYPYFASEADYPTSQQICIQKIHAHGLIFCSPALKQLQNIIKSKLLANVQQLSLPQVKTIFFSMQTVMSNQWTFYF